MSRRLGVTATWVPLLCAAMGCSDQDPLLVDPSGRLTTDPGTPGTLRAALLPLATPCAYVAKTGVVTISVNPSEVIFLSKRVVDSALLVQGETCDDSSGAAAVIAVTSKVKTIHVEPDATGGTPADLSGSSEGVVVDTSNGPVCLSSGVTGGIFVSLGGGSDTVNVLAGSSGDRMGCSTAIGVEYLGLLTPTGKDIKVTTNPGDTYTIDLGEGVNSFDKGKCVTKVDVTGGSGTDTFLAGSDFSVTGDHFRGGGGLDSLSYASRTADLLLVADGTTESGDISGSGEQDLIDSDIETLIGGAGDDTLVAGLDATAKHQLTGGAGNDTLASQPGGKTTFAGGAGLDTVDYSARSDGVVVTIGDSRANDGELGDGDNVALDVENVIGSEYADQITGSTLRNVITPGGGNDTVNGGDGDDRILASPSSSDGNDRITGGKGMDTVDYGLRTSGGVCVVLDGIRSSGSCTFTVGNEAMNISASDTDLIAADVENAIGTDSADHIIGNASGNVLVGSGGGDWIEGMKGDDQLDANVYTSAGGNSCSVYDLTCVGTVLGGECDCKTSALTASCSGTSSLECGGDPLDLAACSGANPSQFLGCWKTQ